MNNFEFFNPVRILFGNDKIEKIGMQLNPTDRILMTYGGGSIKKNGTYERIKAALSNFSVFEFGGIEANPKYETLMKAVEVVKKNNVDFILAIGGGSVIDGTKFIAAASLYEGSDPWDLLIKNIVVTKAIPFGVVLTLPATGSEMNSGAVISRLETREKYSFGSPVLFPKFSVLDPTLTFSLPPHQVANGIADAFIHVMEQYMTFPSDSPIQDRFSESILQTLIEVGPQTLKNPSDYSLRANFMWSCTMALNGLLSTGVTTDWATHMIGHELTAFFGIDHGATLAAVYPALLTELQEPKHEKIIQYGSRVWGLSGADLTARNVINKTEDFFRSLGIKTRLCEYGLKQEDVAPIVERFRTRGWKLGERKNINHEVVEAILKRALEPYKS